MDHRPPQRRWPGWARRPAAWFRAPLGRGERIALVAVATVIALVLLVQLGSHLGDEPLRRELEAKMNQKMDGYTVQLGHAHGGPFHLSLTLRDLVIRQRAHPEPPIATIPRLRLSVEWSALLTRHLVGDALFDHPQLHLDVDQLHEERVKQVKLGQRGWQAALESIYPLKFDKMAVRDGSLVYVDADFSHPFAVTHWNLTANNIRNIQYPDRTYPSPVHTAGRVFGSGWGTIDGNANFLADPFPAWHVLYRLDKVPLANFEQFGADSPYVLHSGLLSSHGDLEYGPRFKVIDVAELLLDGVRLDYVHASATEAAAQARREAVIEAAEDAKADIRFDRFLLTAGQVGFINRATNPPYRLYVDQANLEILNMSNRIANLRSQGAVLRLHGLFMGSGKAAVTATFRPGAPQADLGMELAVEQAQLPAFNNLLRAYQHSDVTGGTVSVYSQLEVKQHRLRGYVKAMFDDIKLYDPRNAQHKPLGTRLKERLIGGVAEMLENKRSDRLATRAEITGTLDAPRLATSQIWSSVIRNAFWKAIAPGFDSPPRAKARPATGG